MTRELEWLATLWPTIRSSLPPPPATVVELGCGRHGGFVPALKDDGYEALGIDPVAPDGNSYRQVEFERSELPAQLNGLVACTSLHHVGDLVQVLDKVAGALAPGGVVVVVEWDWESFDETTARWCFERLEDPGGDGWLEHQREEWRKSAKPWEEYVRGWAREHGIHTGARVIEELDRRLRRVRCSRGPYFFPDLAQTTEADELDAIDAGVIRATRIDYTGRCD